MSKPHSVCYRWNQWVLMLIVGEGTQLPAWRKNTQTTGAKILLYTASLIKWLGSPISRKRLNYGESSNWFWKLCNAEATACQQPVFLNRPHLGVTRNDECGVFGWLWKIYGAAVTEISWIAPTTSFGAWKVIFMCVQRTLEESWCEGPGWR